MGYIRHHAIVVTSWDDRRLEAAHAEATELGMLVTPITEPGINHYRSFLVAPDGSKEGWDDSEVGDQRRADFMRTLDAERGYLEWVEVSFGNDDEDAKVTRHTWTVAAPPSGASARE